LPLMVEYTVNKIYFGLGPSVGFKIFSKLTHFENNTYNITYYQNWDVAGNIKAGYAFSDKLDVNVRYSYGLLNIYKYSGGISTKNRFINLSFLYYLN
jgi:hypothetical protein